MCVHYYFFFFFEKMCDHYCIIIRNIYGKHNYLDINFLVLLDVQRTEVLKFTISPLG